MWENVFYIRPHKFLTPIMISLFGVHPCTIDAKGRIMIPGQLQKKLGGALEKGFMIKQSIFSRSLDLFPIENWEEHTAEVIKLNSFNKENVELLRMFNYSVNPIECDSNSRILIYRELLEFAGIKKDVVLAGAGKMIEVWDAKAYHKFMKVNTPRFEKLVQKKLGGNNAKS